MASHGLQLSGAKANNYLHAADWVFLLGNSIDLQSTQHVVKCTFLILWGRVQDRGAGGLC